MKNNLIIKFIAISVLINTIICISGCFNFNNSENDSEYDFTGNWHETEGDSYLQINPDDTALFKECSVSSGYRTADTGTIDGNKLNFNEEDITSFLSISNNTLILSIHINDQIYKKYYTKVTEIPDTCDGDAIDITSVTPDHATEGVLTTFTVNFNYRLVTKEAGEINLGFNTDFDSPSAFILTDNTMEILQSGTGSGSLNSEVIPVYYNSPLKFRAYVNLSENPHPSPWRPLANHFVNITVDQSETISNY